MSLDGKRVRIVRDRDPHMYDSMWLQNADGTEGIATSTGGRWHGEWGTYDVAGWTVAEPLLEEVPLVKEPLPLDLGDTLEWAVDHPKHYNRGNIEVIDFIEDQRLGFNLGNVVKYVARAEDKGNTLEDLQKAKWYIEREISLRSNA